MNCDELRELTGAYALGAVTPEERARIEVHLAECGLHDEISELKATVIGLAAAVSERAPSAGLGARIADAVRTGHEDRETAPLRVVPAQSRVRFLPWAVAAALALVIGGLVTWNVALQRGDDPELLVHSYSEDDGDWVRIETVLGEPHAAVALGGLDPLPADRDYQLWAVRDGDALSIGVFDTNPKGRWAGDFNFTMLDGDQIAVTIEPDGGSTAPTSEPLLSTRL